MCLLTQGTRYVDPETLQKSLVGYDRVIRQKYVASASYIAENENEENTQQVQSPENVCEFLTNNCSLVDDDFAFAVNVRGTVDEYQFNDMDELEHTPWSPRSDSVLDVVSPSEYLKHQQQAIITYVDANKHVVEDETHL